MKQVKLMLAVLAAVSGIGGAIAESRAHASTRDVPQKWKTAGGATVFNGTTTQAQAFCGSGNRTCARGTVTKFTVTKP